MVTVVDEEPTGTSYRRFSTCFRLRRQGCLVLLHDKHAQLLEEVDTFHLKVIDELGILSFIFLFGCVFCAFCFRE